MLHTILRASSRAWAIEELVLPPATVLPEPLVSIIRGGCPGRIGVATGSVCGFSASGSGAALMTTGTRTARVSGVDDVLISERVAWSRESARHHYVGSLWASPRGIRLGGRDPITGIEVLLSIPREEIEAVRVSTGWDERLAGERSVILELADTIPILLRELGIDPLGADGLAERMIGYVVSDRMPLVAAR